MVTVVHAGSIWQTKGRQPSLAVVDVKLGRTSSNQLAGTLSFRRHPLAAQSFTVLNIVLNQPSDVVCLVYQKDCATRLRVRARNLVTDPRRYDLVLLPRHHLQWRSKLLTGATQVARTSAWDHALWQHGMTSQPSCDLSLLDIRAERQAGQTTVTCCAA